MIELMNAFFLCRSMKIVQFKIKNYRLQGEVEYFGHRFLFVALSHPIIICIDTNSSTLFFLTFVRDLDLGMLAIYERVVVAHNKQKIEKVKKKTDDSIFDFAAEN